MDQDRFPSGLNIFLFKEFDQILKTLGQNLREEELQIIIQKIDRDGSGFIDFDEFLYLVAPYTFVYSVKLYLTGVRKSMLKHLE